MPERWSLTLASLVIFALFLAIMALFGTQVRSQFSSVVERLPFALDNFSHLGIGPVSDDLTEILNSRRPTVWLPPCRYRRRFLTGWPTFSSW